MPMSKVLENEIDRMKKEISEIKDKIDNNSNRFDLKIDCLIKEIKE
jgi:peptidoglycan hydrolase CwlO-like protein